MMEPTGLSIEALNRLLEFSRDFNAVERKKAAGSGEALPDGSFPIKSKGDLKNAIKLAGKAKDPAAAKRHIKKRARALGAEDLLPVDWSSRAGDNAVS
jgi:hypothetical protein